MSKRKSDYEGIQFDEMFGSCDGDGGYGSDEPYMKVVNLDERTVSPCSECGRYPSLHIANFRVRSSHPDNIYMACACGHGDGKWYPTREAAIEAWNALNEGAKPRKTEDRDIHDFIRPMMERVKFTD